MVVGLIALDMVMIGVCIYTVIVRATNCFVFVFDCPVPQAEKIVIKQEIWQTKIRFNLLSYNLISPGGFAYN